MKPKKAAFILLAMMCLFVRCRKDELTDNHSVLIGTWSSISTLANCGVIPGQPMNPNWKLTMMEKGKYRVYNDEKTIDRGRLMIDNGFVTFISNRRRGEFDGRKIVKFNADSLNIDRNVCDDDYDYRFVKD